MVVCSSSAFVCGTIVDDATPSSFVTLSCATSSFKVLEMGGHGRCVGVVVRWGSLTGVYRRIFLGSGIRSLGVGGDRLSLELMRHQTS